MQLDKLLGEISDTFRRSAEQIDALRLEPPRPDGPWSLTFRAGELTTRYVASADEIPGIIAGIDWKAMDGYEIRRLNAP